MPLIELCDVSYKAGGQMILDRVSWQVSRGEHWAVLGPNGAGKTTLLNIACGYLWPNAGGKVLRDGKTLLDLRMLRRSIGWVTVALTRRIPDGEASLDTVVSGRLGQTGLKRFYGTSPSDEDFHQAEQMLADIGGSELAAKPFGVLSQGEKQKVLIARARMARPWIVVLDEPCAGLDPGAREEFLSAIQAMTDQPGCPSLVLTTHHLEEIMPAFTHTLVMQRGRIMNQGATSDLVTPELVRKLYGAPQLELVERSGRYWPIFG